MGVKRFFFFGSGMGKRGFFSLWDGRGEGGWGMGKKRDIFLRKGDERGCEGKEGIFFFVRRGRGARCVRRMVFFFFFWERCGVWEGRVFYYYYY